MTAARWTGYLLLPIAFLMERLAWFAVRTVLWEHVAGAGAAEAEAATRVVRTVGWLVMLSPIAGAAVGWALGARRTLMIGLLGLCAGYLLLVSPAGALPGAIVMAIAAGLARPAFLAVAGAVSPDPDETPRTTLFLVLYAMNMTAGFGGPAFASNFRATDFAWILGGGAALALLAAGIAGLHVKAANAAGAVELEPQDDARPFTGAAAILAMLFLAMTVLRLGAALLLQSRLASQLPPTLHPSMLMVVLFGGVVVWIGLAAGRARAPAVVFAAIGLIVLALAPLLIATSVVDLSGQYRDIQGFAHLGGAALLALGEGLVMAFLLSRLCSSAPRRLSVAFAAAWFLATSLSTAILGLLPDDEVVVSGVALLLTSITCLVAGIYVLVRRKHVRALFEGRAATGSRPR